MAKKRVFSGIQPSGNLHIGNYFGAILTWVREQDEKENIFCVVDEHAITVPQDPKELHRRIIEVAKVYLAAGIDPKKSDIFVQSSRPEHTELGWILNCFTNVGSLTRMTQFKTKAKLDLDNILNQIRMSGKALNASEDVIKLTEEIVNERDPEKRLKDTTRYIEIAGETAFKIAENLISKELKKLGSQSVGLFDYPVLMAADILLYDTNEVPVGEDQKQHVELTRDIAERMNRRFGKLFTVPEYYTVKEATRIMNLQDPAKKMSKSDENENSRIEILDTADVIRKKFAKAVTDSGSEIKFDKENKPGISNLLNIMAVCTATGIPELEKKYKGVTYGDFKKDVAEAVVALLEPFQARFNQITDDEVVEILKNGAERVAPRAKETLKRVKDAIGLGI